MYLSCYNCFITQNINSIKTAIPILRFSCECLDPAKFIATPVIRPFSLLPILSLHASASQTTLSGFGDVRLWFLAPSSPISSMSALSVTPRSCLMWLLVCQSL